MKILHIISQSPDFTGSGKYIREIIRHSNRHGHDNYLVAGAQADFEMPDALIPENRCLFVRFDGPDLGFPIPGMSDNMPYRSTVFSTMDDRKWAAYTGVFREKIGAAVAAFKPDILHTHHLWAVSAISRDAAPHLPMVTTCHGTCLRQHYLCPERGTAVKKHLSRIDRVIALSRDQQARVGNLLDLPKERIPVISGGYNKDCFFAGEKPLDGEVVFVYAGKLSVQKGVPWMLNSFERIKGMPFKLHLAGNANENQKNHCLALAGRLGPKAVCHGPLSHRDLGALMRRSHVFILPSFYEGLPLVLMEALACGCRIIATALPGVHEIFNTHHPEMVNLVDLPPLKTIDAPHEKDEEMLETRLSKILSRTISSVAGQPLPDMDYVRSATAPYTWEKIYTRIESVYRELIN